MNIGSIVTTRSIRDRIDDEQGKLRREITWQAKPTGSMYVVLILGVVDKGELFTDAKYLAALKDVGLMAIPDADLLIATKDES